MKILSIAGARPNFMKIDPIAKAIERHNQNQLSPFIEHVIVHTGQHYDKNMSKQFFEELGIHAPHYNLEVGSGSHAKQTAQVMERFETALISEKPDFLVVVGDVNSTIACALVAAKIEYPQPAGRKRPKIVHVEAGLRSFDRDMPEEINRLLTDTVSDHLFVTEEDGVKNLVNEGVPLSKIHFVGNVMIDTLISHKEKALKLDIREILGQWTEKIKNKAYGLVTLHRPSNVDRLETLLQLINCLQTISEQLPLIFPVHPRTKKSLLQFNLYHQLQESGRILFTEPLGYLSFLNLLVSAKLVLTDSGGIQEETTYLGIHCITLRENTERPVTITMGTNYLVGVDPEKIIQTALDVISGKGKRGVLPPLWDGKASERIIERLCESYRKK